MRIDRRTMMGATAGLATLASAPRALAQEAARDTAWPPAESFRLWPKQPPNAPRRLPTPDNRMEGNAPRRELHLRGVAEPVVGVYRAARPDGRAVLSMPGGGYRFLSVENEGINVAKVFNPLGVTVFVLAYRLPGEGWLESEDVPLQDAQRAMRLIRADAVRYGVDPAKLGTVGFSAGGLLAASLATASMDPVYDRVDAADAGDARPAFAGLVYPVITGDRMRVGARAAARFDTNRRVRRDTPPIFIAHALDDTTVPVSEPMAMLTTCQAAQVPVEAHFFQEGGHGFGPAYLPPELPGSHWPQLFDAWTRRVLTAG
ncbi:alpha/beta hydrolase [Sphingomonas sp. BK345]|uniref:alpha/beta hydrolase n=1 Tax=Sphingomonas sp. BK345 TaxID=2586980 RepID=UPI001618FA31|nr:alpha/beta hydrolase [Sphingomonas sp. BK345]MBB3473432.1 acetyl esterase/lipase [Sphingomonas sp. BK345]